MTLSAKMLCPCLVLVLCVSSGLSAVIITTGTEPPNREEVHNMLPDIQQSTWCKTEVITQIVTHENCESQRIDNQVCVGKCFSYSLPKTEPLASQDKNLNYCESCQPSDSIWLNLTMDCSAHNVSYQVSKRVQQISNCTCNSCPIATSLKQVTEEKSFPKVLEILSNSLDSTSESSGVSSHFNDSEIEANERAEQDPSEYLGGPGYQESVGPNILEGEEGDLLFNPEGEPDPNLIPSGKSVSSGSDLELLVDKINVILNKPEFKGMSIGEIKKYIEEQERKEKNDGLVLPIDEVELPPAAVIN